MRLFKFIRPEKKVFFWFGGTCPVFFFFFCFGGSYLLSFCLLFLVFGGPLARLVELVEEGELVVIFGGRRGGGEVDAGRGGLGEDARPVALGVVGVAVPGVAVLQIHQEGRLVERHLAELGGARALRGRRERGERGGHIGDRRRDSGLCGGRGLLGGTPSLHLGDLGRALLFAEALPGALALGLGGRDGRDLAIRGRRHRGGLRGGLALTGLGPPLTELGLTAADLWGRPGRTAREDVGGRPRAELGVLVLQGGAELHAADTKIRARVAVVLQDLTDLVGEEPPRAGRGIRLLAGLALLRGRGSALADRPTELGLEGRELRLHLGDGREDSRNVDCGRHLVGEI